MRRHASERCIHPKGAWSLIARQDLFLLCAPTKSWSWIWSGKMWILTYAAGLFGGAWYTCGTNSRVLLNAQIYLKIYWIEGRKKNRRNWAREIAGKYSEDVYIPCSISAARTHRCEPAAWPPAPDPRIPPPAGPCTPRFCWGRTSPVSSGCTYRMCTQGTTFNFALSFFLPHVRLSSFSFRFLLFCIFYPDRLAAAGGYDCACTFTSIRFNLFEYDFQTRQSRKSGHSSSCKLCVHARSRRTRSSDTSKIASFAFRRKKYSKESPSFESRDKSLAVFQNTFLDFEFIINCKFFLPKFCFRPMLIFS